MSKDKHTAKKKIAKKVVKKSVKHAAKRSLEYNNNKAKTQQKVPQMSKLDIDRKTAYIRYHRLMKDLSEFREFF